MADVLQPKGSKVLGENIGTGFNPVAIPGNDASSVVEPPQVSKPVSEKPSENPAKKPVVRENGQESERTKRSMLSVILKGTVVISVFYMILFVVVLILGVMFPNNKLISDLNMILPGIPDAGNTEPTIIVAVDPGPVPTFIEYTNALNRFSFRYPERGHFSVSESSVPILYKVVHSRFEPNKPDISDFELIDGYIFKILVYPDFRNANLANLANEKRTALSYTCPDVDTVTPVREFNFKGNQAFGFEVTDCRNIDYIETFVKKEEIVYEIVQMYAGEVGYKQQHFSRTEEMKESFTFLRKSEVEKEPEPVIVRIGSTVTFTHYSLDTCCSLLNSIPLELSKVAVLGFSDEAGFGVYSASLARGRYEAPYSFDEFLEVQKKKLEENYILVTERAPSYKENEILVGNVVGYKFEDLAWWGDIYFVKAPREDMVVVVSTYGPTTEEQRAQFDRILSSFTF